jgi:hypothetical protein
MQDGGAAGQAQPPALLADHTTTMMLFGPRRGRVSLAIHEDARAAAVPHRAVHADERAAPGDLVRGRQAGAGERHPPPRGGVRLGRLLQRPQGRLRHPEEGGLRRRAPRAAPAARRVDGRRRAPGAGRQGRS